MTIAQDSLEEGHAFLDRVQRQHERRDGPLQVGQADGIACRTVEMFESFGLSQKLLREAYWVNETVFWRPSPKTAPRSRSAGC